MTTGSMHGYNFRNANLFVVKFHFMQIGYYTIMPKPRESEVYATHLPVLVVLALQRWVSGTSSRC